ncbi:hypothetical protein MUP29_09650 [bacterium]|nr:hypothetical protein [bacterium]
MARPLRLKYPGAFYHINNRGNHQEYIFRELEYLFNGNELGDPEKRDRIIQEAFKLYAYTQSEIAAFLGLDRTTISKIVTKTNR